MLVSAEALRTPTPSSRAPQDLLAKPLALMKKNLNKETAKALKEHVENAKEKMEELEEDINGKEMEEKPLDDLLTVRLPRRKEEWRANKVRALCKAGCSTRCRA